jgi:uncharacterized protein DUF6364
MQKLTLSVDPHIVARAKRYAKQQGTSVSEMVETYLAAVSQPSSTQEVPPISRSLRGVLKKGDVRQYRKHLVDKYR